jgi:hypothetical protein
MVPQVPAHKPGVEKNIINYEKGRRIILLKSYENF